MKMSQSAEIIPSILEKQANIAAFPIKAQNRNKKQVNLPMLHQLMELFPLTGTFS